MTTEICKCGHEKGLHIFSGNPKYIWEGKCRKCTTRNCKRYELQSPQKHKVGLATPESAKLKDNWETDSVLLRSSSESRPDVHTHPSPKYQDESWSKLSRDGNGLGDNNQASSDDKLKNDIYEEFDLASMRNQFFSFNEAHRWLINKCFQEAKKQERDAIAKEQIEREKDLYEAGKKQAYAEVFKELKEKKATTNQGSQVVFWTSIRDIFEEKKFMESEK